MQGFCVLYAAGNRVGQVDLIPLAVQVYLVPSVVAGAGVALGQCARDALAAAHCCKQRGKIVADTGGALQGSGGIRDVLGDLAAGHRRGRALGKGGNFTVGERILSSRIAVNGHL